MPRARSSARAPTWRCSTRVRSTDIRGNLNELISKSNVIQELLAQQLAVLDDRLVKTIDAHGKVLVRGQTTAAQIKELSDRLDSLGSAVSVLIFICVFLIAFLFIKGFGVKMNEGRPG